MSEKKKQQHIFSQYFSLSFYLLLLSPGLFCFGNENDSPLSSVVELIHFFMFVAMTLAGPHLTTVDKRKAKLVLSVLGTKLRSVIHLFLLLHKY